MPPEACGRLTTPVAPCRVEIAKSGCPVLVPTDGYTSEDAVLWARRVVGLTSAEIRCHPEHGMLVSLSGVRKLAAMAPDSKSKLEFIAWLQDEFSTV